MTVWQLNKDQMDELKVAYVTGLAINENRSPCMSEVANAPDDVADDIIYNLYKDITFSPDDFWCTAGGC